MAVRGNKEFKVWSPPNFLKIIPQTCWNLHILAIKMYT